MSSQKRPINQVDTPSSKLKPKESPKTNEKNNDDIIYAKDKSPDDLEILE